jgi:uncharacterized repeat protein (TIGR03803 family)
LNQNQPNWRNCLLNFGAVHISFGKNIDTTLSELARETKGMAPNFASKLMRATTVVCFAVFPMVTARAQSLQTLYVFKGGRDGASPDGALTIVGGAIYGMTNEGGIVGACDSGCGTIYKFNLKGGKESILYRASADGDNEAPGLVGGLISNGATLFGTIFQGGASGAGLVFDAGTSRGGALNDLYSFNDGADGGGPYAGVIYYKNLLYGTTTSGGSASGGTVFSIDPSTKAATVIYSFKPGVDGTDPLAALTAHSNDLYGTTAYGPGKGCYLGSGCGTVFKVNPVAHNASRLYSFSGKADGGIPFGTVVFANNEIFGTTFMGGEFNGTCKVSGTDYGCGTVFKLDPATGLETVIHEFQGGADGGLPYAGLTLVNQELYGVTSETLFEIDPNSGQEAVLASFPGGNQGALPLSNLLYKDGALYGTTSGGGGSQCGGTGCGTIFVFTP